MPQVFVVALLVALTGGVASAGLPSSPQGAILVSDFATGNAVEVDPATGDRSVRSFSNFCTPKGAKKFQSDLVNVYVTCQDPGTFEEQIRVCDLNTDACTILSDSTHGSGPNFGALGKIADKIGKLVAPDQFGGIKTVNKLTGDRAEVCPTAAQPVAVTCPEGDANCYYVNFDHGVHTFNPDISSCGGAHVSGPDDPFSSTTVRGSGDLPPCAEAIMQHPTKSDKLIVVACGLGLREVDKNSGDRVIISGCPASDPTCSSTTPVGAGPLHGIVTDIAAETSIGPVERVVVSEVTGSGRVMAVDLATGDRTVVSDCVDPPGCATVLGSGPNFDFPLGITVLTDGTTTSTTIGGTTSTSTTLAPATTTTSTSSTTVTTTSTTIPSVGITGKKLIMVDKLSTAGKAKIVYVAKDTTAAKGTTNNRGSISATLAYQVPTLGASGSADMPSGSARWLVNKDTVAKYVNKDAPMGGAVKVGVIKPGKLLKAVLKDLGDSGSEIDIYQGGGTTNPVDAATQYTVIDGATTVLHCGEFTGCVRKIVAGGTGAKVVCKTAVPGASVICP